MDVALHMLLYFMCLGIVNKQHLNLEIKFAEPLNICQFLDWAFVLSAQQWI